MKDEERYFSPNVGLIKGSGFGSLAELSGFYQEKHPRDNFYKPVALEIELTNRCNLRCRECAISKDIEKAEYGLDPDLIIKVLREAGESGFYAYSFTGGEPFLRFADMAEIISAVNGLDCYKIQTNGTFFVNVDRGEEILNKLRNAGFGNKNEHVKSSLRCSVGIQDKANPGIGARINNLSEKFYEIFPYEKANLAFIITHDYREEPASAKAEFISHNFGNKPIDERIYCRPLPIHSTYENAQAQDAKEELGTLLDDADHWNCFDNSHADTPWPKMLIRANGDVYSCPSFAHVFKLGNVKKDSLKQLLRKANENEIYRLIHEEGLCGLLKQAEHYDGAIKRKKIAASTSSCHCQICKILKNTIERQDRNFKFEKRKKTEEKFTDNSMADYNHGLLLGEMRKRGVKLEPIGNTGVVEAKFDDRKELLFGLTLSSSSYTSAWIASDKFYSKKFLKHIGIPTPEGGIFPVDDRESIIAYADRLGYPLVLKPLTGSHGDYVYPHIDSVAELRQVLVLISREYLNEKHLLIEEHLEGREYRLFVTRKNFFAAVNRVPANVIGDGRLSLNRLIEKENQRRMNPRTNCLCTIKLDDVLRNHLGKQGLTLDKVPKKGEKVRLRHSSNVCMGGNCLDVTDQADLSVKKFAFDILENLTGLAFLGIDLICEDISKPLKSQHYGVCELNCSPGLSLHTVPEIGKFRDTPGAVIDLISINHEK
jgi:cyanophycin synthetase